MKEKILSVCIMPTLLLWLRGTLVLNIKPYFKPSTSIVVSLFLGLSTDMFDLFCSSGEAAKSTAVGRGGGGSGVSQGVEFFTGPAVTVALLVSLLEVLLHVADHVKGVGWLRGKVGRNLEVVLPYKWI